MTSNINSNNNGSQNSQVTTSASNNSSVGINSGGWSNSSWSISSISFNDPAAKNPYPWIDHFYVTEETLDFDDVMLVPTINHTSIKSRKEIDLTMDGKRIPIVAANMDYIGTFPVAKELSKCGLMTAITKHHSHEDWKKAKKKHDIDMSYLIPTIGLQNFSTELDKLLGILSMYSEIDHVCFDVANGYLSEFRKALYNLKKEVGSKITIIAGNVVTDFGARVLYENGASCVKTGIGSGSNCTSREMAGIGYPQFSSLLNCEKSKQHYPELKLMSDGGCVTSGDIAKAFGIADYVMIGGMLAGHHETGSLIYGNSSEIALKKAGTDNDYRAPEGRVINIEENRGHLVDSVKSWLGGLRSACTYCNSSTLMELKEGSQYVKVRHQLNTSLIDR